MRAALLPEIEFPQCGPGTPFPESCLKSTLKYVTPSEARGLGWWVQAAMVEPRTRFLVASLLGMTVLRQDPVPEGETVKGSEP